MSRWVMHVDMDAFYASVEQYRVNPELCGLPVCVGHDPKEGRGRGVVRAASYEARDYGIRSGMPVTEAYRLCPDAVFVRGDFSNYIEASDEIMSILEEFADDERVRRSSIDEAYIDVTRRVAESGGPEPLAKEIQRTIKEQTKLPCSIGVAPNMAVAKIATGINKPMGITLVPQDPSAIAAFLAPLDVRVVNGIGHVTARRLSKYGITTLGQVQRMPLTDLYPIMGVKGAKWLSNRAYGVDTRPLKRSGPRRRKSISKDRTFMEDIDSSSTGVLYGTFDDICKRIWTKLQTKSLRFRTVTVKIRYSDYTTVQRSKTLKVGTDEQLVLCRTALALYKENLLPEQRLRLIGVKVSNLLPRQGQQSLSEFF
ncbi:MAG: DNA polymerase IV [Promethearchaeota archaeon]